MYYSLAGTCKRRGQNLVKFSNNPNYPNILAKEGYTDIEFLSFEEAITKGVACQVMLGHGWENPEAYDAIASVAIRQGVPV